MTYRQVTTSPSASSNALAYFGMDIFPNRRPDHTDNSQIIRSGSVSMKEDSFGSWLFRRKWLVLRESTLSIHRNESASQQSVIMLDHITKIERIDMKPYCLLLQTIHRRFYLSLKSDEELYDWLEDIYSLSPLTSASSNPTNFVHKVHVGYDPISGGLTGMSEWNRLITKSSITNTKEEDGAEDSRHLDPPAAAFRSGTDNPSTAATRAAASVNGSHYESTLSTMTVYAIFEGQEPTVISSSQAP
ncbi:hypothetical protein BYT27DRAFT_7187162 [Phlegmacium glaucopus]|nr:hypothetical protein BYT27DRAFT_7187162 [Phlegmacium glaucopus]